MRFLVLAAALTIGGTAVAQDAPPADTSASTTTSSTPARDARGIAVVSDPATAPAGFNQPPQPGGTGASPSQPPAPQPDTSESPPCSRTVTDNCVQTYERGRAPN